MAKRTGNARRKTRHKLSKNIRERGKLSLTDYFQSFNIGDKVAFSADSSYQKGMYYPRFHGKIGSVMGKRGECYIVQIKDGSKKKEFIVHPVHLKGIQNGRI